ncbi:hypothetical protein LTR53_008287 [Teratosphaeriaceae sp. CCFEE 6253]|nr:hypothetical protein LTR53_008287 [Teratosphaeriaceae sp. CCFEE 6253]
MSTPARNEFDGVGNGIPRFVQFTSPVSTHRAPEGQSQSPVALPLNLIALITQWIDDTADLARLTRTCRLLYYMTLPQLYQRVTLRAYPAIRYVNGRPEGFGGGSPFVMALSSLVTGQASALVEEFRVWGAWREAGQEDFAKGRIPDNSMMLNILLRAATDKMVKLRSFSWELDCKPLKTLYQGLATHETLTTLNLKFPNSRVPRPSVMIPPLTNLRVFKATEIDPLCYPDDISMLLLDSRKLEDVRLHFSPRMRREAEPTLNLQTYFGRLQKASRALSVKHFAAQNFFGMRMDGMNDMISVETCRSLTFIDMFGNQPSGSARNVYIDDSWKALPENLRVKLTAMRTNEVAIEHVGILKLNEIGLEKMYFISPNAPRPEGSLPESTSPITPGDSPPADEEMSRLGKEYVHVLTRKFGHSLRHLLLREEWALTPEEIGDIVRYCPNLEQFGLAINSTNHTILRLLVPFLPKVKAIRLLHNEFLAEHMRAFPHEERMLEMSKDLSKAGVEQLEWYAPPMILDESENASLTVPPVYRRIGVADAVYKVGKNYQHTREDGTWEWRREVTWSCKAAVAHVEIWGLDNLDISADPIAPFSP